MEQSSQEAPSFMDVTLRRFKLSDLEDMEDWASDLLNKPTDPLLPYLFFFVLPHPWYRAICLASDDRPIGAVYLTRRTRDPCRAELSYQLAQAHRGKGVMTAAVKQTVATVFEEMEGLKRVEALVDVANPASQRVLEKAGFTREGVLRKYGAIKDVVKDMFIFSFIDTDPLVE